MLAQQGAWTAALPPWLGRAVGWSEIGCAAALLLTRLWPGQISVAVPVAGLLIVNQGFAAAVHAGRGETDALPQNAVLVAMLAALILLVRQLERRRAG